jgi:hypothetical protein
LKLNNRKLNIGYKGLIPNCKIQRKGLSSAICFSSWLSLLLFFYFFYEYKSSKSLNGCRWHLKKSKKKKKHHGTSSNNHVRSVKCSLLELKWGYIKLFRFRSIKNNYVDLCLMYPRNYW